MNSGPRPLILLDPHPRRVDVIFDAATKPRLETLGNVIWQDGSPAPEEHDALLGSAACGRIRVAIDVWPEEPIPPGHRPRRTPNMLLQAQRSGNFPEIWPRMGEMVVDDLELILRNLPPPRCQRAQWETVSKIRSKPIS